MKGISLIEVLIALTILSTTMLCAMGTALNSLKLSQLGVQNLYAMSDCMTLFEKQQYGLTDYIDIEPRE